VISAEEDDARQFPERPTGPERGPVGPAEVAVDPALPHDDNERADELVETVKEPADRR
jgi:hypothetical protein